MGTLPKLGTASKFQAPSFPRSTNYTYEGSKVHHGVSTVRCNYSFGRNGTNFSRHASESTSHGRSGAL